MISTDFPSARYIISAAVRAAEAHREAYGSDHGAFYLNAYSATQALLNAIAKAGSTDYGAVSKSLRSEYASTPLGDISFDARGDAVGVGFSMYQVRDGAYVEVK